MRKEYDFTAAKRGAVLASPGKTRITIMLDDDVIAYFRKRAEDHGAGYQTLVNAALRRVLDEASGDDFEPVTVRRLRQVLREELRAS